MPSPKLAPLLLSDAERKALGALARKRKASQALAALIQPPVVRTEGVLRCAEPLHQPHRHWVSNLYFPTIAASRAYSTHMKPDEDPFGLWIKNALSDNDAAYAKGQDALDCFAIKGSNSAAFIGFMSNALGRDEQLIEVFHSKAIYDPGRTSLIVLKLSARSDQTWRIIVFNFPEPHSDAIHRATNELVSSLRDQTWLREPIEDGDDLFWWDDQEREWKSCLIPHPGGG